MTLRVNEILVSVKFDLGGTFADDAQLDHALRVLTSDGAEVNPDGALNMDDARTYNISYLATHPPIQTVGRAPRALRLGATEWSLLERVVIYPWLGVFSVDLHFREPSPEPTPSELLSFYAAFIAANNIDYMRYLEAQGLLTRRLREYRASLGSTVIDVGVGARAIEVREVCANLVTPRKPEYPFQNVRVFYALRTPEIDEAEEGVIGSLANLSSSEAPRPSNDAREAVRLSLPGLELVSSGWSTVAVEHRGHRDDGDGQQTERAAATSQLAAEMFGLVHAQWFLCQLWSGIGPPLAEETATADQPLTAVAKAQSQLSRDLVEVANIDVMFRDPTRIALTAWFVKALRVDRHRQLAKENLDALLRQYERLRDERTARFSTALQVLFALAAAASVAALVQPLSSFKWLGLTTGAIIFAVALWLARRYGES